MLVRIVRRASAVLPISKNVMSWWSGYGFGRASCYRAILSAAGGVLTAVTLTVGNRLFIEYMRRFGASSLAGATGSVLVGLVWIYTIAQIVLAGAELTRVLQRHHEQRAPGRDLAAASNGSSVHTP